MGGGPGRGGGSRTGRVRGGGLSGAGGSGSALRRPAGGSARTAGDLGLLGGSSSSGNACRPPRRVGPVRSGAGGSGRLCRPPARPGRSPGWSVDLLGRSAGWSGPLRRRARSSRGSYSPVAPARHPERSVRRREATPSRRGGLWRGAAPLGPGGSGRHRGSPPCRDSLPRRGSPPGQDRSVPRRDRSPRGGVLRSVPRDWAAPGSARRPDGQPPSSEPNPCAMPHSVMDGQASGVPPSGGWTGRPASPATITPWGDVRRSAVGRG